MELKKLREIKKVFVSIGSKAASGGYYAALGGSRIVAEPGSITGSIGVIMKTTNYATIADRFGVSFNVIKSGKFKDIGDSFREMTSDEKTVLSGMVSNVYGQFVDAIVTERKLDKAKVAALADGRIYTGLEAVSLGLIDGIGTLQDVIELAAAENKMPLKNIVIVQAKSSEGLIEKLFAGASASISNMLADAIRNADISTDDNLKFLFQ
jgi:protease-4